MTREKHMARLTELQTMLDETLSEPANSYTRTMTRPKLIKELGHAVEEARKSGVTVGDIDEMVTVLRITNGRRPIELENFWDPRRITKSTN